MVLATLRYLRSDVSGVKIMVGNGCLSFALYLNDGAALSLNTPRLISCRVLLASIACPHRPKLTSLSRQSCSGHRQRHILLQRAHLRGGGKSCNYQQMMSGRTPQCLEISWYVQMPPGSGPNVRPNVGLSARQTKYVNI